MAKREIEEHDGPILIEPSQLFCQTTRCVCKHKSTNYGHCKLNGQDIGKRYGNRAPDWCPKKWDALFPRKD